MKNFASAVSQMAYNLLGYCLSPLLSGIVMTATGSRTWGFRVVMGWSVIGAVCMLLAWRSAVALAAVPRRSSVQPGQLVSQATIDAYRKRVASDVSDMSDYAAGSEISRSRSESTTSGAPSTHADADGAEAGMVALDLSGAPPRKHLGAAHAGLGAIPESGEGEYGQVGDAAVAGAGGTTTTAGGFDEDEDDDEFDSLTDANEIKLAMIYRPSARHSMMGDFSSLWTAQELVHATTAQGGLIMSNDGKVASVAEGDESADE